MNYWIVIDRRKYGPLTIEELRRLSVGPESYVWHRGLPTWVRAKDIPELASLLAPAPSLEEGAEAAEAVEMEMASAEQTPATADSPEASDEAEEIAESVELEEASDADVEAPVAPARPLPPPPPPAPYAAQPSSAGYIAPPPPASSRPECPPSYLGWCVAAIILCCLIPAIVALIYSVKVNPLYMRGDYDGARKASERAEIWLLVAITLGIVSVPFQIVMMMLSGGGGM